MTAVATILAVALACATACIVVLARWYARAHRDATEAIAARQRAEHQLQTTSREFAAFRHDVKMEELNGF